MEDKRKIYLLLIVLVLFVGLIYIVLKKTTKEEIVAEIQIETPKQIVKETPKQEETKKEESKFPTTVKGIVVSMTNEKWSLEQEGRLYEIGFKIETPVFKGSKENKVTIFDVKAGTKLEAILNQATGEVEEAVIGE